MGLFERIFRTPTPAPPQRVRVTTDLEEPALELVTCGIYERGGMLYLCPPDAPSPHTVKIVTTPLSLQVDYDEAYHNWGVVQSILSDLPKALRPRKPSVRRPRTEIPDLADSPTVPTSSEGEE
jgi:hypothetical protein